MQRVLDGPMGPDGGGHFFGIVLVAGQEIADFSLRPGASPDTADRLDG